MKHPPPLPDLFDGWVLETTGAPGSRIELPNAFFFFGIIRVTRSMRNQLFPQSDR